MVLTYTLGWGQMLNIASREEWRAKKADLGGLASSILPFTHVIFQHSGSAICGSFKECSQSIRTTQADQIDAGCPDIHYNFMICGDGRVYKCRGWYFQPTLLGDVVSDPRSTLTVGFVGNWENRNLPFAMNVTGLNLIKFGLRKMYISNSFKLTHLKRHDVASYKPPRRKTF